MDEAISASVLIMGCKMTYKLSVSVRDASLVDRFLSTRFSTSIEASDLFSAVSSVIGIFSSCKWFSVCLSRNDRLFEVYDSETGFDYRFVDLVRNS